MANLVWVRGVIGRLTRVERKGEYLPVDAWTKMTMTRRIQKKADRGSLEISFKDPNADTAFKKPKPPVKPAEPYKEAE